MLPILIAVAITFVAVVIKIVIAVAIKIGNKTAAATTNGRSLLSLTGHDILDTKAKRKTSSATKE